MILKNNLYKTLSFDSGDNSFSIELLPENLIYRAHFPEQPITPGVCIIQIASELLSELLSYDVELRSVTNAKFLAVITPENTRNVTYTFKKVVFEEDDTIKVSVIVSDKDIVYTKLSLVHKKK